MIVSHRHRFIFLHCCKVAGSSITALLNRHLGPDDIQVGAWPDAIEAGGRYNRTALRAVFFDPKGRRSAVQRSLKKVIRGRRPPRFSYLVNGAVREAYRHALPVNAAHSTAATVRRFVPEAWESYYKFCFVRNPFDQAVSHYYWRTRTPERAGVSFEEYLRRRADRERPDPEGIVPKPATNWEIYTIDDRVAVDFVGRYETLGDDLRRIGERLGIDLDLAALPRSKGGVRRTGDYREKYTEETIALVRKVHAKELAHFGYEF